MTAFIAQPHKPRSASLNNQLCSQKLLVALRTSTSWSFQLQSKKFLDPPLTFPTPLRPKGNPHFLTEPKLVIYITQPLLLWCYDRWGMKTHVLPYTLRAIIALTATCCYCLSGLLWEQWLPMSILITYENHNNSSRYQNMRCELIFIDDVWRYPSIVLVMSAIRSRVLRLMTAQYWKYRDTSCFRYSIPGLSILSVSVPAVWYCWYSLERQSCR